MPFPHAGEISALLAPLCWAVAVILYRRSVGVSALSMNLFKNALAVVLLGFTVWALGVPFPADRSWTDWLRLVASGVLGLAVADTLLFEGLRRVGAARVALVDTVYAPLMVVLSWAFLGERPSGSFLIGAAAVVVGVTLATVDVRAAFAAGERQIVIGMTFALGAIVGTVFGVLLAKPVLEESDLFEVTLTRLVAGNVALALFVTARGGWREASVAFRPAPVWKTLVPGAVIGTYLSLVFWLGGFKWGDASVAAVLNQMATVYILALARIVLGETLEPRQVGGALVAAGGALFIVLAA
ncbi:MAG: DMT family transporter [Myxococcota bacterium]